MEFVNDMPVNCAVESPDNRSWWQRSIDRLFPYRHCPSPESPETWKDCITTRTVTKLDWADWLRVIRDEERIGVGGISASDESPVREGHVHETVSPMSVVLRTVPSDEAQQQAAQYRRC